jgi:hypothetical protein
MNRAFLPLVLVAISGPFAAAQQPMLTQTGRGTRELAPASVTPDMWYYSQEKQRHDDPKQAVRRKAEFATQQRQMRIASMKWYGMSNSRPTASTTPFMDEYSPSWIGNGYHPYHWVWTDDSAAHIHVTPVIVR